MKPRFTADEAVLIIKAARGKNCAMKKMRRKKKLVAIHKVARLYAAKAPMEKKAAPLALLLTLASFSPEILRGLKWAGRGIGLLGKAKGAVSGLSAAQRMGGALYRGGGRAAEALGGLMGRARGTNAAGNWLRGAGKRLGAWGQSVGQTGFDVGRMTPDAVRAALYAGKAPVSRGVQAVGDIARYGPLAYMGLSSLGGTGVGDGYGGGQLEMPPQMVRLGSGPPHPGMNYDHSRGNPVMRAFMSPVDEFTGYISRMRSPENIRRLQGMGLGSRANDAIDNLSKLNMRLMTGGMMGR